MIENDLIEKYGDALIGLDIYEDAKSLKLARIIIKPEFRNSGVGTNIMTDLINYADKNKQIITLTPSSDFGGDKNRLIQFYKKFGFKLNKGVHKSYEYMDTMIRWPKMNQMSETKELVKQLLRHKIIQIK
jgi:predicted GNAT family N-acyltransferase